MWGMVLKGPLGMEDGTKGTFGVENGTKGVLGMEDGTKGDLVPQGHPGVKDGTKEGGVSVVIGIGALGLEHLCPSPL